MSKHTLTERFAAYHAANPQVYAEFRRFAVELMAAGRTRGSAALIFERIRWETMVNTRAESKLPKLKLNNNYRAFYARQLVVDDPSFRGFFELREQKSVPVAESA